jgi:hypothetical protein
MRNMFGVIAISAVLSSSASAAQFTIRNDVCVNDNCSSVAASYIGSSNGFPGAVLDGGFDAFDAFGHYTSDFPGLALHRQTEAFQALNLYRFFDTFTNTTSAPIAVTLVFDGDLGSDSFENVRHTELGLIVTCQNTGFDPDGCDGDPVLALVSGNSPSQVPPSRYQSITSLTIDAGESVSLLHFAFLALDADSLLGLMPPSADDVLLAISTGQSLLESPYLHGLTDQQIVRIANFDIQVAEPTTLALFSVSLLGLGYVRRRAKQICSR